MPPGKMGQLYTPMSRSQASRLPGTALGLALLALVIGLLALFEDARLGLLPLARLLLLVLLDDVADHPHGDQQHRRADAGDDAPRQPLLHRDARLGLDARLLDLGLGLD